MRIEQTENTKTKQKTIDRNDGTGSTRCGFIATAEESSFIDFIVSETATREKNAAVQLGQLEMGPRIEKSSKNKTMADSNDRKLFENADT